MLEKLKFQTKPVVMIIVVLQWYENPRKLGTNKHPWSFPVVLVVILVVVILLVVVSPVVPRWKRLNFRPNPWAILYQFLCIYNMQ